MTRWEKTNKDELEKIIIYSGSLTEICYKLGYNRYQSGVISQIKERYPEFKILLEEKNGKKIIDLTGKKFNHLTVIKLDIEKNKEEEKTFWICECDCSEHTRISVEAYNLKSGHTQSCGCIQGDKIREDLVNQHFGKLTVLELDKELTKKRKRVYWKCQCECGTIKSINKSSLISGDTLSCGCLRSRGEEKIAKILSNNQINFTTQYTFSDLKGINNGVLSFDFAIFDKKKQLWGLVEYQGIQHYKSREYFGGEEQLKIQQANDQKKEEYCLNNHLFLIKIPYKDYNNITLQYLNNLTGVDLCQL